MENKLSGSVENIVYKSRESGFAVLDLAVDDELVTVVGDLFDASEGEQLTVWGEFVTHATFGRQFKVTAAERVMPSGVAAIEKYLASGALVGIGPATAKKLVSLFGDDTLRVLEQEPARIAAIKGISRKKADGFSFELRRQNGIRSVMQQLGARGLDTPETLALFRIYGDSIVELLDDNPYLLCGFPLYKEFEFADAMAGELGFSLDDARRIRAGLIYILRHNLRNGHTCLPVEPLLTKTVEFLELGHDDVEIALYNDAELGVFACSKSADGTEFAFLPALFGAEQFIAERLRLLRTLEYKTLDEPDALIDAVEKENDIEYASLQREAIRLSLKSGAVVITGGPGTGKTTALKACIALCEAQGDSVMLAAPTGRAAKRLAELTGRDAKTIHRLLEVDYAREGDENIRFVHNEENPLECDVVVVDEMSMVDVALFESLLRGIRPQCRLILVGDTDQLPSVGAGNLLRDLIDSGVCPAVELEKIFRQAAESLIVVNAHRIVSGEMPDLDNRQKDFFFLETEPQSVPALICSLVARRLPKSYGFDALADIQVLCPQRKGQHGTLALNDALRSALNPGGPKKAEARIMGQLFRAGDKVMQTRNNYDLELKSPDGEVTLGVYNGDIGTVAAIDRDSMLLTVQFDDRKATYSFDQARELEPAFAATVHKSQGSEFRCVVLSVSEINSLLCYRNLLYTAVTRARELLVIVGQKPTVEAMVENDRKSLRFTGLLSFLRD